MAIPKMALSIRQPWAWCILHADKDIENRSWPTRFRGPVAVHAARGMTRAEYEDCLATVHAISLAYPFPAGLTMPAPHELELGGIVGTVEIVDCVRKSASPWFFGQYGFVLRNAKPVDFIPVRGALGFFEWQPNVLRPKQEATRQEALF